MTSPARPEPSSPLLRARGLGEAAPSWVKAARRTAGLLALVACAACAAAPTGSGSPAPSATAGPSSARGREGSTRAAPRSHCTEVDAAALLRRHAEAFGAPDALRDELPRTLAGEISRGGRRGSFEIVLDRTRHRSASSIGGLYEADGVDERGSWSLGVAGTVERTSSTEAVGTRFEAWLLRREYGRGLDPARTRVACELAPDGAPRAVVRYDDPDLGNPRLSFDLESGALVEAQHTSADGTREALDFTTWTVKDAHGVRWPSSFVERRPIAAATETHVTTNAPGLACVAQLVAGAPRASDCLAPPSPTLTFVWPDRPGAPHRPTPLDPTRPPLEVAVDANAPHATEVTSATPEPMHVPMTFAFGEPVVRVRVGERDTWAIVDSGAMMSLVDSTTPLAGLFRPTMSTDGAGLTQTVRMGLGELANVRVGGLTLLRLPAVSAEAPALDALAPRRPELLLGYSLFASLGVRIDYAAQEIVLAPSADRLHDEHAVEVPLRVLEGKIFVEAKVEGQSGAFLVDTGDDGGFEVNEVWATPHGLPGTRPTVATEGLFGVGTAKTSSVRFRAARSGLGPISFDDRVVSVGQTPGADYAGRIGNEVLSRCRAVVFDVAHRKLWLAPPCDRAVPELKSGFVLERREDPAFPEEPWVVSAVVAGGSAARSGVEVGDRLLQLDGKAAGLDASTIRPVLARPAGARVPLVVARHGERKKLVLELVRVP